MSAYDSPVSQPSENIMIIRLTDVASLGLKLTLTLTEDTELAFSKAIRLESVSPFPIELKYDYIYQ